MRFADPFILSPNLGPDEKLEAERLMFLELTQGTLEYVKYLDFFF